MSSKRIESVLYFTNRYKIPCYRLHQAEAELQAIEEVLTLKQAQLSALEDKIVQLQEEYDSALKNLNELEAEMMLAEARLNRSGRLTSALVDERIRWEEMTRVWPRNCPRDCKKYSVEVLKLRFCSYF